MLLNMALPGFTYAEEDIKTTLDQLYQDLTRMLDADISTTRFVPGTLEGLLTNGECQELKDKYSKFIPFDGPIQSSDPRFSQYRYTEKNVHRSLLGIV